MKPFLLGLVSSLAICFGLILQPATAHTQTAVTTPASDPQAVAVLQQSVVAMGTTTPSDSTATGTITTIAGSLTENGTITILTRRTDQTSEQIQTPHGSTIVYSQGQASTVSGSTPATLPMERAVTSQSAFFPLALFAGALNNADTWKEWTLGGGAKVIWFGAAKAGATWAGGAESAGAAVIGTAAKGLGLAGTAATIGATMADIDCQIGDVDPYTAK